MTPGSHPIRADSPHPTGTTVEQIATVLEELETSLEAAQKAMLSGDLAGLEQATGQQLVLQPTLQELVRDQPALSADSGLVSSFRRLQHLARVHLALLGRAQQAQRILANRRAGLQSSYAPTGTTAVCQLTSTTNRGSSSCRA
jgi:hypothetical protein